MSIILLPFKLLAVPAQMLFGIVGVFIVAIVNAMIMSYLIRAAVWNGLINVGGGTVLIGMVAAFILTFWASGSK